MPAHERRAGTRAAKPALTKLNDFLLRVISSNLEMKRAPQLSPDIKDQAIAWLVRRHSGRWSWVDARAFEAWLAQSAAHREIYEQVQQLWAGLGALEARAAQDLAAARAYASKIHRSYKWRYTAAVALGFAGIVLFVVMGTNGWL